MEHKFISSKKFFSAVKKAVSLYKNIWREGTTCLIHGPRTADKTAAAYDIAVSLANSGREVLYVNAEGIIDQRGAAEKGADNLYVFTPEYSSPDDKTDYADLVFEAIEQAVATTSIRTFVIDSVSRNASPAYIMKRLVALQVKCKLSVLAVAHDSTKSVNNALLALAASEITVDEATQSENSEYSEISDHTDNSETSVKSGPADLCNNIPVPVMTRQQRRALERRAAKEQRRAAAKIR